MQVSWRTNVQVCKFHLFFNNNLRKPRDLMRNTTFVIFALSLVWLFGCITQGRLTSLTFKKSFNYKTLDSSMEKLKSQYESSLQEQVSALREIRYISKHIISLSTGSLDPFVHIFDPYYIQEGFDYFFMKEISEIS